jgi:hypothetical protein
VFIRELFIASLAAPAMTSDYGSRIDTDSFFFLILSVFIRVDLPAPVTQAQV